ncbi:MAG TPA: protein YgfX [Rhodanobacteraceae bacterium]|nr:protein YgfX [Rhodanobacteraceae bacterium]
MTQAPDTTFHYRASPTLSVALVAVGLLAILAVSISGVPMSLRITLIVLIAALAGVALGRLLRPRVGSVAWRGDGTVELALNDTPLDNRHEVRAELRGGRVLGPLIVLSLRWPQRERAALWLLPDNLDADVRRRLRMRLGTHAAGAVSGNADSS